MVQTGKTGVPDRAWVDQHSGTSSTRWCAPSNGGLPDELVGTCPHRVCAGKAGLSQRPADFRQFWQEGGSSFLSSDFTPFFEKRPHYPPPKLPNVSTTISPGYLPPKLTKICPAFRRGTGTSSNSRHKHPSARDCVRPALPSWNEILPAKRPNLAGARWSCSASSIIPTPPL